MPEHLPLPTGPFAPGIVDVMLDYTKEAPLIRLYYPTNKNPKQQSDKWIRWLPDDSYLQGISRVLMIYKIVLKLTFWWSEKIKIPASYGAKPKTDQTLKCIILSHGLGGCRFLYTNVCCELASRGFLVAAIEHKDHSACSTFYYASKEDAQNDKRSFLDFRHVKLGKDHYSKRNDQLKIKSKECGEVLDFLLKLHEGAVPHNVIDDTPFHIQSEIEFDLKQLVGKLDVDNMIIMGHSFGAATALHTLSQRPEFKLGILMDPWMFPIKSESLEGKIRRPLLFVNTQTFHVAVNVNAMSKLMDNPDSEMYTIKHTTHENQTDSVLLIGYWLNWFMKKLDPLLALRLNNSLILKFVNRHLSQPDNISDCLELLEEEKDNVEEGLTKPWA